MLFKYCFVVYIMWTLLLSGCTKATKESTSQQTSYTDYYTIQVGQSVLYRLDSIALTSFGADTVTHTYWQKDSVMSVTQDLTGGLQYNVNSYIKSYSGEDDWEYLTSYRVTPDTQKLEMVNADNLRFIKLVSPVSDDYSWDGNAYFMKDYTASTDDDLAVYQNWDYQYANKDSTMVLSTGTFSNTVTVKEIDTETGAPFDGENYYSRLLSVESYAKGIGLIHRKFLYLIWQNSSQTVGYESTSYGVELTRVQ